MKRQVFGFRLLGSLLVCALAGLIAVQSASAQIVQQAVGGVAIDGGGIVSAPTVDDSQALQQIRRTALEQVPKDLEAWTDLRAVSLKSLEAQIAEGRHQGKDLPDAVKYLAGLQRVQYVLVYPEQQDILLAGPAEGWKIDSLGTVVGATSNRPVLLLDDLIVALRTRQNTRMEPVSCSIDPTAEGLQRVQQLTRSLRSMQNPESTMRRIEEALGQQNVTITGVPASSHFARVMVAADFRMKRLAMDLQAAPIDGMPSFLHLVSTSSNASRNMTPRWWLAPNYEPLAQDAEGLAWEIRGQAVKCMTEEDYFDAQGNRQRSTQAGAAAVRWADTFTERFAELAAHDSSFGQLRNLMDLAVIAALLDKEMLLERSGVELPHLLQQEETDAYVVPRSVATQASFVQRRGSYVISASGGVQLLPWLVANNTEVIESMGPVHQQFSAASSEWYRQ